jgi:formate dehydrogenase gamma subunit
MKRDAMRHKLAYLEVLGFLLALALPGWVGTAAAGTPEPAKGKAASAAPSSEECLGCHADKGLTKQVGGNAVSLFTDEALLKASVHGRLACIDCHAGIVEVPHAEKLAPVSCQECHGGAGGDVAKSIHAPAGVNCQNCHGSHTVTRARKMGLPACEACHARTVRAYQGGVHGRARSNGILEAARCGDCHGETHQFRGHADPQAPTNRLSMAETCGRCHADRTLIERRGIPIPKAYQLYQKSVHGRAVAAGKAAATCNDCHENHDVRRANDPTSSIYRENIPKTCAKCHVEEARVYQGSIHGTAVARGVTKSPVCTDCHGEHSIRGAQDPASRTGVVAVSRTCASCHEAEGISEKYGIPGGRLETYSDSFHGLAIRGGSKTAANCASCHGVHDIRPSGDPRSAIHPTNLPTTCGKCHPGAGENFAKGAVHVALGGREEPILFYVGNFYIVVILVTISGMGLHNGLDFLRKLRRDYRRRGGGATSVALNNYGRGHEVPQRWIERMTLSERLQHALLASSFIVLVYTGFALKFPESWLFTWFVALEQGSAFRSGIHRIAALVMILACLWHVVYLPSRRGRGFLPAMLPRYQDVKEAAQNLGYLLGLRGEPPTFDRFGYIEKAEYWALIWGSVVMVGTGLMLWFENWTLTFLAKWVLDLVTIIHYYEAWLAALAIVVWHFYYVIFNPDVYPMNWTWLTGKVSEEMLRHEHPREYERLRQEGQL